MDRHGFVAGASPFDAPDMPAGTRVRYFAPAPALAASITAYNCYATIDDAPRVDPFLPMMMMVNILIDAPPVAVQVRNHRYDAVPEVALYGAMTRPLVATTRGGVMIGASISPVVWARLSRRSAVDFHNRIVPLGGLFGPQWGEGARGAGRGVGRRRHSRHPRPPFRTAAGDAASAGAIIAALGAIVATEGHFDITTIAAQLGVTTATLRRIAQSYFGLPPKQLLRRARFLRSFLRESGLDGDRGAGGIDAAYYDASHYLRDANSFLGMTPRRFLKQPAAFLRGSLSSRPLTLGVAAQVLHHVDPVAAG